jgi:tripartite-type tricarboxylate transporter receptor subunit TctC
MVTSTVVPVKNTKAMIRAPKGVLFQLTLALTALLLAEVNACAQESDWPSRTVQIVVPYTPGTGADILARILGPKLAERWKVAVVTDNRAGASGNIGTDFVAKSAADGYTVLCTATSFGTNPAINRKLPFDPVKSFSPVIQLASSSVAVIVTPSLPAKSMREFIELARSQPGRLYYSSPGNGGPQHLAMELLKLEAHIDLVHVPYKGSGGALADLVGGHVQAMIVSLQTVAPYVQSGKLRMLAVMSAERSPAFPDIPTLKESGHAGLVVDTWYGVFAPAGTPAPVIARLNAELNTLLDRSEIRDLLAKQGMAAAGGSPQRFGELVREELARWSRVVTAAGIRAD